MMFFNQVQILYTFLRVLPRYLVEFDRFDQHSDGSEERSDGGVACPADRWRCGYTAQGLQPLPNQSK